MAQKITEEIRSRGQISFAAFMEHALYCPVYGFYEAEKDTIGKAGHFYTSASVGPLFGELIAFQFARWLLADNGFARAAINIVEAGGHDGKLARDILAWLSEHEPALAKRMTYTLVEPSERRRRWQQQTLKDFGARVAWASNLEACGEVRGILFCNELLDAMPTHRLGWDAKNKTWFEWGVTLKDGRLDWARMERGPETPAPKVPAAVSEVLPNDFTTEFCEAAVRWWGAAAAILKQGRLVAFDYGATQEELLLRTGGTLRAYHKHAMSSDVLQAPGECDITAHVNFTAIRECGENEGLATESFSTQSEFLTGILAGMANAPSFAGWTSEKPRQFQTLTHPEHLGRSFRVLVQSRL